MITALLLSSSLLAAQVPPVATNVRMSTVSVPPAGAKSLLTQGDFTYRGSFRLSSAVTFTGVRLDHVAQNGFALRPSTGTFYAAVYAPDAPVGASRFRVYEARIPSTLATNPAQAVEAAVVRTIGVVDRGEPSHSKSLNLFWDEQDGRLYYVGGDDYHDRARTPSFGYATLDAAGRPTIFGPWSTGDVSTKWGNAAIVALPQAYADRVGGKRLAVCCGAYESLQTAGPISAGPSLVAFDPRVLATWPPDTRWEAKPQNTAAAVPVTVLLAFPFHQGPAYTDPQRAQTHVTNYTDQFTPSWPPKNGVGYYTDVSQIAHGVWIDTPTKHGVVFFPNFGTGLLQYFNSDRHSQSAVNAWQVYDPERLMEVAAGKRQSWQVQPSSSWTVQYPGVSYPLGTDSYGWHMPAGGSFNSSTRDLYLVVRNSVSTDRFAPPVVHVYRVAL